MPDCLQPKIDFAVYSDRALEEAYFNIDRERYSENFGAVTAEIARRKSLGRWQPSLSTSRAVVALESAGTSALIIDAYKHPIVIVFMAFWLMCWLLAEISLVQSLLMGAGVHEKGGGFMTPFESLLCTLFWSLGGSIFGGLFLWMVAGKEIVSVDSRAIHLRSEIFGVRIRSRRIPFEGIDGLRLANLWRSRRGGRRSPVRAIQIVTAQKTITFGKDIGLEESGLVLRRLVEFGKKRGFNLTTLEAFDAP